MKKKVVHCWFSTLDETCHIDFTNVVGQWIKLYMSRYGITWSNKSPAPINIAYWELTTIFVNFFLIHNCFWHDITNIMGIYEHCPESHCLSCLSANFQGKQVYKYLATLDSTILLKYAFYFFLFVLLDLYLSYKAYFSIF